MVPQFCKFIVVNNSGLTMTYVDGARISLKLTRWFIDPATGKVDYTQSTDDDFGFTTGTIADGAEVESSEINNTVTNFIGMQAQVVVIHDLGATADGAFAIFFSAGDATGELPSDLSGYVSAEINMLPFVGNLIWPSDVASNDTELASDVMSIE